MSIPISGVDKAVTNRYKLTKLGWATEGTIGYVLGRRPFMVRGDLTMVPPN